MIKLNKKFIIKTSLLLGLTFICTNSFANDLNKIDIKRNNSSSSALNVTIYTANPYNENVAVSKKSDDKYVILLPNISGVNAANIDYSAIKDLVSDVSLKSVEDSSNGYTKITLTTTKPVSITTNTKKSTPLTEEQKAYKNLIAQAKGYSQPETKQANNSKPMVFTKPTENIQEQASKKIQNPPEKNNTKITVQTPASPKQEKITAPKKQNVSSKTKQTETKKEILQPPVIPVKMPQAITEAKEETSSSAKQINETTYEPQNSSEVTETSVKDAVEQSVAQNSHTTDNTPLQNNDKGTEKNMLTTIIILLSSMFGLIAFFNGIKSSIEGSAVLKKSFKDNLHEKPHEPIADYSDIATDSSLSWQEKYQKYLNSMEEINPEDGILKHIGNGEYEFVNSAELESIYKENKYEKGYAETINNYGQSAMPKAKTDSKFKSYNRPASNSSPSDIPPIRKVKNQSLTPETAPALKAAARDTRFKSYSDLAESLERTLHDSPDLERIDEETILKQLSADLDEYSNAFVNNEEDAIYKSVKKAPKLKTFAHKLALEETRRNIVLPKHSSDIIKLKNKESKYVNLENSSLYSAERSFIGANLSSADLIGKNKISTSNRMTSPIKSEQNKNDKYSTISVDEFFDTVDSSSRITAPATLASRVADRLSDISLNNRTTETQNKSPNPLDGKIIRAGYNIDDKTGFYITSDKDGKYSLIGKADNNITILKEFSSSVESKLQVRKDSENVYMVKAAGERYLVEINGNKMGVLIEL